MSKWVKLRNTRSEHLSSEMAATTDMLPRKAPGPGA
jgi:hypothetical protein